MKQQLMLVVGFALLLFAVNGSRCGYAQGYSQSPQVIEKGGTVKVFQGSTGGVPQAHPSQSPPTSPGQKLPPGVVPPGAKPPTPPGKPDSGQKVPGKEGASPDAPGGEAKPPATIKRIEKPPAEADPKELEVRPGPDGVVHFQFRGQNWPDVLDWYAEIAGISVDWQELPGDYLNISTQSGYRVKELGGLLNRLLLARGFTMLPQDEFINVVKCEELNAALVPRVRSEQLDQLGDYEFVRVMFNLDSMLASVVLAELEPLMSNNGKLFALKTTNRIEAMDAVCNLREIQRLLEEEQQGDPPLVEEFVLQYARAEDVRLALTEFLGASGGAAKTVPGMSPQQLAKQQQQMQQMQMQMQQMAAQARSSSRSPSSSSSRSRTPSMPTKEAPVRMMVNPRRNSILVQAPPDKMATIAEAINMIDVPERGASSLQAFLGRMQVYRLVQLDPAKLVESLKELGGLDPTTRLEVDETNRAIIAYATPADHHTIRMTVEKLDGSARRVEVIPLRRLAADEVAGTIQYLMAGSGEQDSNSRSDYWDPWGYSSRRRSSSSNESATDKFRVDADVVQNRLLVRANDMELEEVVSILVKLGEMPQLGRATDMTRVLDIAPGEETEAFLQRLKRDFKMLAPNELILPEVKKKVEPEAESETPTSPATDSAPATDSTPATDSAPAADSAPATPATKTAMLPQGLYHTAVYQTPAGTSDVEPETQGRAIEEGASEDGGTEDGGTEDGGSEDGGTEDGGTEDGGTEDGGTNRLSGDSKSTPNGATAGESSPIIVSIGPDGRIALSSRDGQALDLLEQLAERTAPPNKDYRIFTLKNAPASWVVLNLEEFFEDEDETEQRRRDRMSFMWGGRPSRSGDDERRLSKRRPLRFITDLDTNTILVQNADAQQLATIADLIELYDVPEPVSSQKARVTKLFTVKYSKASIIADTIKDAYRDLLSSNDRALQNGGKEQKPQQRMGGGMTVISAFGFGDDNPSAPADSRTSARFEGKLSIGVDDLSNTMLVSTEGESLMMVVADMIEALDEAAMPVSEVRVVKLSSHVDGSRLQSVLDKVLNAQAQQSAKSNAGQPRPESPKPSASGASRARSNQVRTAPRR